MSSVSQLQRGESIELMVRILNLACDFSHNCLFQKKWLAFMGFPDYAELFVSNFFDLTHLSRVTAEDVRNVCEESAVVSMMRLTRLVWSQLGVENMDVGLAMEVFRQYAGFCAVKGIVKVKIIRVK